jgi:hypothetical protein
MESVRSILTISELAQALRCSKAHVHKALTGSIAGVPRLAHLSLGRRQMVATQWFDQWLEENRTKTADQRNGGTEVGHGIR